jgi:hypothetical protein
MTDTASDGSPSKQLLFSFNEVVRALGGVSKVAKLTDCSRSSVWNWRKAGAFPPRHYRVMRDVLFEQGYVADLRLWAFTGTEKPSAIDVAA